MAIFELAVYLAADIEAVINRFQPVLSLNVYVDDVTTRVVHESMETALEVFIQAGAMLVHRIDGDTELDFSSSKAMLLANNEELLAEAPKAMGGRAVTAETSETVRL